MKKLLFLIAIIGNSNLLFSGSPVKKEIEHEKLTEPAKKELGERCNSDADCISGICNQKDNGPKFCGSEKNTTKNSRHCWAAYCDRIWDNDCYFYDCFGDNSPRDPENLCRSKSQMGACKK